MFSYILKRLLLTLPVLVLVLTIAFVIIRVAPGDISYVILGEYATPEAVETLRSRLGLDQPIWRQYVDFVTRFASGNLGESLKDGRPIGAQIARVMPYTVDLAVGAIIVAILIGIPLGIFAARHRGRPADNLVRVVSLLGVSTPTFYLGVLIMLLFGVRLQWFPVIGGGEIADLSSRLRHLALPMLSLGLVEGAVLTRITRTSMLEVMQSDFIRTARAKGVPRASVILRHALRNALLPIATVVGFFASTLLGGAVLTETVFSRPGLGKFLLDSIQTRDYPSLEAGIAIFALIVVMVNLIVDILYAAIDPRIRY